MAIGTLALCYNNIEVFRGVVKLRRGAEYVLLPKVMINRTRTMADVYQAFSDFSDMLKSKVDNELIPIAQQTITRLEARALRKFGKEDSLAPLATAFAVFPLTIALGFSFETCFLICCKISSLSKFQAKNVYLSSVKHECHALQFPALLALLFIILAILYAYLSANRPNKISKHSQFCD
ncbi:squalene synthase [Tanacetum coccineum]